MHNNFQPFPELSTERLELRQLLPEDEHEIYLLRSDPRMLEYVEHPPARNLEDAQQFIQKINAYIKDGISVYWAIALKNNPRLIGTICLWNLSQEKSSAEFGYALHPDFQGQGYMQEAFEIVETFGFEVLKAHLLEAHSHKKNTPSIRLLERQKYIYTGEDQQYAVFTKRLEAFTR